MKFDLGVHHVSLNVDDLDACLSFYVDTLGLTPIERPDLGFPGAWLAFGPQELHLLQVEDHQAPDGQHFAFRVTDLDATLAALDAAGVKATPPFEIPGVCRQAFLKDPAGNLLELNEPKSR
ncbi:MAG: VOC family protein [Myxococcota bacterium]